MFKIIKRESGWWHIFNSNSKEVNISDFEAVLDNVAQTFIIQNLNGANVPKLAVSITDIVVIDETDGGVEETFATVEELKVRLTALGYTPYLGAGNADSITGLIQEGTNVTITGSGTLADPYIISASGGSSTTPTLQEVTDEGNITDVGIELDITGGQIGTFAQYGDWLIGYFIDDAGSIYIKKENTVTGEIALFELENDKVSFIFSDGVDSYEFETPTDKTGTQTFAMLSDITGGVSDGDKGDITVSSSGTVWTIDNGLDATKIADGSVSNTEFQYINSLTANAQTQIDSKEQKASFMCLSAPYVGTSGTALQKIFNVGSSGNGEFNALANKAYEFTCEFDLTAMATTAGTFSFGFLGTATLSSLTWKSIAAKGALATASTAQITSATVGTATVITGSSTSSTGKACITGVIRVTGAGTIIPAFAVSVSATPQVEANSIFIIRELGSNTVTASSDIS